MAPKSKAQLPGEVFLSHSSKDRKVVAKIAETLRAHGIPVWYGETNLRGAQQWHDEIGKALARCDWFLIVLSPSSVRSQWVKRELHYALRDERYEDRIMPVLHRACDSSKLSWTLAGFQTVDFTGDFAASCRSLLRAWGLGFQNLKPSARRNAEARARRK